MPDAVAAWSAPPAARERLDERRARWEWLLSRLATPCLVVCLETARANCALADAEAARQGVTIRPHAKAHKTSRLLRLQAEGGVARGVCCATAYEARALAELGFADVLVANEALGDAALEALAAAARAGARVTVAVDSEAALAAAAEAARRAGATLGVLVDLDVGSARCGVAPASPEVAVLAEAAERTSGVVLEGVMGYSGRANYLARRAERAEVAAAIGAAIDVAVTALTAAGLPPRTISGGSTGLFDLPHGLTEVQLGSYVLMEARYASVDLPFAPACFCAATVLTRRREHAVLNCGWKALGEEFGLPVGPPWLTPLKLSDEHLVCRIDADTPLEPGDVVLLVPAHIDPTVNLHERLAVVDGAAVEQWPVDLRRSGSVVWDT